MLNTFRTYQLARKLYREAQTLGLKGEIRDQLHRASLSVCLNLAEGTGRRTLADRKRFYAMALGSLREVQALLDLTEQSELAILADHLGASLWRLNQKPGPETGGP